jgi:ABC-2 type transport system permease protein
MLGPVRAFAENQPVASIVDAIPNRAAGLSVMTFGLRWRLGVFMVAYVFAAGL